MRTRYRAPVLAALSLLVVVGVGCSTVKAKAAFKDGNKLYKEENYRKAIDEYEKAVALKPDFAEAHFYLASSHQSLYRPGKEGDENKMHLDKAIEHYEKSLEVNKADNAAASSSSASTRSPRSPRSTPSRRSRTTRRRSATPSSSSRTTRTTPRTSTRWRTSTRSSAA